MEDRKGGVERVRGGGCGRGGGRGERVQGYSVTSAVRGSPFAVCHWSASLSGPCAAEDEEEAERPRRNLELEVDGGGRR